MRILALTVLMALAFSAAMAMAAKPDFQSAAVTNPVSGDVKHTVSLPPQAVEVAPNVYYLGSSVDNGKPVDGYALVDYKEGFGKPTGCNNDGKCQVWEDTSCSDCQSSGSSTGACYAFLGKGVKWKTAEPYLVDPQNLAGLSWSYVRNTVAAGISKWETAASYDIVGDETEGTVDGADMYSPDGKNEVMFGNIAQPGAIGVTIIWGTFRGPPGQRQLIEWDQVYNHIDYGWSYSSEPGKMVFENIATHELGHTMGLDDLYDSSCSEMTMYGYADYGETRKSTLEDGDIAGILALYAQ